MKKCKEGHYYCYQDSKCKPIPKGFRRGVGGYLRREREDEKEDSKKNGNGNGKSNGSSNGNGNGGNGSGNGNGGNGGNGGGNGSGGVGESVEIQNSDGDVTALVTDIIGPDHMRPRLNGKGVWTGTHITEAGKIAFGGYKDGIIINPSGSRNQYGLPDNLKPETKTKEVPLTPSQNRLLVSKGNKTISASHKPDGDITENNVALPFFLKTINKTNALKKALPYLTTAAGGFGSVLQMARPRKDGSTNDRKNLRPDLEAELRQKQKEREEKIKATTPNLDDKLNTPTDQQGFVGGKKVDKKTLERMKKPENQFNSYDPLTERKKLSGNAIFPFKANVKIKNEIISDDGISTKNSVKKKYDQAHYEPDGELVEKKMTEKEKRKDDRLKKKYDKSDMKKSMQKQYGKEEGKKVYFATIRKQAMEEEKKKDHEPEMIRSQLKTAKRASKRIKKHTLKKDNFKAWVQSKITKASDYLDTAADYLDSKDDVKEGKDPKLSKIVKQLRKSVKSHGKQADYIEKVNKKKDVKEESNPRIPRKKGQPANSKKHSDLYTDENPKGTIHGLGFKDVATAKASVAKIRKSNRSHAHKIQAAVAMEQRAREMGKTSEAAVYRKFINSMKKKTKS